MPDDAPPLTWTMTRDQVEWIWKETREVFGNKLWFESMMYADDGIPEEWQEELARRSGQDIVDTLTEAVGDLRDPDPSLVFRGLHDTFARYGITLNIRSHPVHGDVLERARELVDSGVSRPAYGPVTWNLDAECVASLRDAIEVSDRDSAEVADALADCLGARRADELSLRCGEELRIAVYIAMNKAPADADTGDVLLAMRDWFASPYHGQVTLEYAPHPSTAT
jgi:hypothetical protein